VNPARDLDANFARPRGRPADELGPSLMLAVGGNPLESAQSIAGGWSQETAPEGAGNCAHLLDGQPGSDPFDAGEVQLSVSSIPRLTVRDEECREEFARRR